MTTCGELRDALLRGEAPDSPAARAHLESCPACAALAKSAGPLRAAFRDASPIDVDALYAGVKAKIDREDQHFTGYLRSRPTWLRVTVALAAVLLSIGPVGLLMPRDDLDTYPPERLALTFAAMALSLLITIWIALR